MSVLDTPRSTCATAREPDRRRYRPATRLVQFDACPADPHAPISTPLYQTATFEQPGALQCGAYDYSRSGNPTRTVLEGVLAELDGAAGAAVFASGMAAVTAVTRLVPPGGEIVAGTDLYGGTFRLLGRLAEHHGIAVRLADARDPEAVAAALSERTSLVLVETPTNPLLEVCDIVALADLAHGAGALLAVDNSLMSPYLQRPLELGADLAIQSATKALSGHSDLVAGVVAARDPELAERVAWLQNAEGAPLGPFECWLLLRSLKTLAVRLDRQEATAHFVADFLRQCPEVERLHYPGEGRARRGIHFGQSAGAGPVMSFRTRDPEDAVRVVENTRLFKIAVSFGSVVSVISLPVAMSHASVPEAIRQRQPLPDGLVRLSVGLEDPDDLVADLEQALART